MMRLPPLSIRTLAPAALLLTTGALAHMGHEQMTMPKPACESIELNCARTASAAFAPDGTLWLVWDAGGRISVGSSRDLGASVVKSTTLPQGVLPLDDGPDARPKIVIGRDGRIIVTFATRDDKYNGHAFVSWSDDGGKTFSKPAPITANSPSQRFETPAVDADGRAFFAWIDKGDAVAARVANRPYAGAALAYAWDNNGREELTEAKIARDQSCECCRIAVAFAGAGKPVILFRNIFEGGIRDHAVISFANPSTPGPLYRLSDDDAAMDACPHQGPSLAISRDGIYHATWLALGRKRKGLFYARSLDGGATFSSPLPLGDTEHQNTRPFVLAGPDALYLAYKTYDGERTTIDVMTSHDSGMSWSKARTIASTAGESDHPQLIADGKRTYLSWFTSNEGLRLIALEALP